MVWSPIMVRQTKTTETKTSSCPHCCKFPSRTLQKPSLLITRSATLFANHELWTTFSSGLKLQSSLTVYTNRHAENWSFVGKKCCMNTGQMIFLKKICKRKSSITTKRGDFYIWLANLVPDVWIIIHKIFFFLAHISLHWLFSKLAFDFSSMMQLAKVCNFPKAIQDCLRKYL